MTNFQNIMQKFTKNREIARSIWDPLQYIVFEACNEGNLADFMINYRKVKQNSVQAPIIESLSEVGQRIIEKLKELQVQV